MKTTTKHILSLAALCTLATTAHASDSTTTSDSPVHLVLGSSLGAESQSAFGPLGLYFPGVDQQHATLAVGRLHVGASVLRGWIEPGIDLEAGQGADIRSSGGFLSLRVHAFPSLRVHPLVVAGVGLLSEHGTRMGDEPTGLRRAVFAGPGIEVRVDSHWTIGLELRLLLARSDHFDYVQSDDSVQYYVAHGGLIDFSTRLGATYRF